MLHLNTALKTEFKDYLRQRFDELDTLPTLNVVQVGEDKVSNKYVGFKQKLAESLGLELKWWKFDAGASVSAVEAVVENIPPQDGLIYQLPIPARFDSLVENTHPYLDVDLLGSMYSVLEADNILPPTIGAIDLLLKEILQSENFDLETALQQRMNLEGTRVGVVGQGKLVGAPLVRYLLARNATVASVNVDTVSPEELISKCDIVVCAAGSPKLVTKDWLKPEAIVIDAATSEGENALVGDVDLDNVYASNIVCTTPHGVGGITVLYLFYNLLRLARRD